MRRYVLTICALGLAASALGTAYTFTWDAEVQWLRRLDQIKSAAVSRAGDDRILLVGGSSVLFGLDPLRIEQLSGRSTVNLGMHAGLGALALLGYGESHAVAGDTIVLSLEPDILVETDWPDLGRRFAFVTRQTSLLEAGRAKLRTMSLMDRIENLATVARPGLSALVTKAADYALGERLEFRYPSLETDDRGYIRERVTNSFDSFESRPVDLGERWPEALTAYEQSMRQNGVEVVYALPWVKVTDEARERAMRQTGRFLSQVNEILPVVAEKDCGIKTLPALFSDSPLHLSLEGAELRSSELGSAIFDGDYLPVGTLDGTGCE